ncbi:MAG: hypothetical protein QOJ65_1225 [Fimbriimonadaceae bacterium]|nr:hypothetical protein [Fimbriimonadaceae bacterium]
MNVQTTSPDQSHASKLAYLASFSEDDFRDLCVRPLLKLLGMTYYRDLCGVDEEGKDAILIGRGPLQEEMVYAIQTKKGKITMAASANEDLLTALRQVRMSAETVIDLPWARRSSRPDAVYLIASGEINYKARRYIVSQVSEAHLHFWDANDLIAKLDANYPEFWHGINADRFPYIRAVISDLLSRTDIINTRDPNSQSQTAIPITDDVFVSLYLSKIKRELKKRDGRYEERSTFVEVEADDLLKQRESLKLVIGEGGAGKSTLLRRLAYGIARRSLDLGQTSSRQIPVLFRASELANSIGDLKALLYLKVASVANTNACCVLPEDLETGGVVILIDALDEVSSELGKETVIRMIRAFHREHPAIQIILTSRDVAAVQVQQLARDFATYYVTPISLTQASRIVDRVVDAVRGDLSAGEKEKIENQCKEILRRLQDVHGIDLNPFLVTIFVASEDFERRDIPPNITEIIKKFTEQMLGRWDQRKGLSQQFEYSLKDYLVSLIAFHMHADQKTALSLTDFSRVLELALKKMGKSELAPQVFDEVVFRSGLFFVEAGAISFKNHIFQEFFAGRAASSYEELTSRLQDEWWTRPIMFFFGDDPRRHAGVIRLTEHPLPGEWRAAFTTAVAIGLALQSAYFADEEEKIATLNWVVDVLSKSFRAYLDSQGDQRLPLSGFIYYYLVGREAVATELSTSLLPYKTKRKGLDVEKNKLDPIQEMREFWRLVALLEAGLLDEAKSAIHDFRPDDDRLLLAILMSCMMIANLRVSSKTQKKLARDIGADVYPRVQHLVSAVAEEVGGILLEMQRGKVAVLDAPVTDETGQAEMVM